jgi:hypothetical protein
MSKRACSERKMDDAAAEVLVKLVNPPKDAPILQRRQFGKRLDVLASVLGTNNHRPVLLIGCQLEGKWVALDLLKEQTSNWWDRLHQRPERFGPNQQLILKNPTLKSSLSIQREYNTNLSRPKRFWTLSGSAKGKVIGDPAKSGRRLSLLPPERWKARAEIHKEYARIWRSTPQGRAEEEDERRSQMDRMAKQILSELIASRDLQSDVKGSDALADCVDGPNCW